MFRQKLQSMMIGRNGFDHFCRFLLILSAIFMLLSTFMQSGILYLIALLLLGYGFFRMMSKNLGNRLLENQKYLQIADRIQLLFKDGPKFREKRAFEKEQRKIYKVFTCKSCGQKVRVPRGRGKIEITCPKCKTSFIKRT